MNDQRVLALVASLDGSLGSSSATLADAHDVRAQDVPTPTRAEFAEMLLGQVGLNKREPKDIVGAFSDVTREALGQGDSIELPGFGSFQLRDEPQRPGRNPRTGKIVPITARHIVALHVSQKLKALVEGRVEPLPVDVT